MAQVLIRNLRQETIDRLKEIAAQNHRSLEAELRALAEEAASRRQSREQLLDVAAEIRRLSGPQASDSVELIREDRER